MKISNHSLSEMKKRLSWYDPPGGQRSDVLAAKYLKMVRETGWERFEWLYLAGDGEEIPVETTLVASGEGEQYRTLAYSRDLRESVYIENQLNERSQLIESVNESISHLSAADEEHFEPEIMKSMLNMADLIDVDGLYIWQNINTGNEMTYKLVYGVEHGAPLMETRMGDFKNMPVVQRAIMNNRVIEMSDENIPINERKFFDAINVKYFVAVPLLLQNEVWGFVSAECASDHPSLSQSQIYAIRSSATSESDSSFSLSSMTITRSQSAPD
ncbi:hypothetical protein LJC33_08815 [Eubacteriales bacterium OttesenSCG-928-N13]|nr:hypothetical protein [Eubacteriales bacterium OttesenSCG-928-N13]